MTGTAPQTDLIIELLGKGVPQRQVCIIVDAAPSTVSEVATHYAEEIALAATGASLMQYEMDELRDDLELNALKQLKRCLPLETDPLKLTRIVTAINGMARRSVGERPQAANVTNNITNIQLPAAFLQQRKQFEDSIVLNAASEVVAIGDRTTAPASRDQIQQMAAKLAMPSYTTPEEL